MWKKEFRLLVKSHFEKLRSKNPSYTTRSFARRLRMSPGAVSEILRGKRFVSVKKAESILEALRIPAEERLRIKRLADEQARSARVLLPEHAEDLVGRWLSFGLLSFYENENAPTDSTLVARRMGVAVKDVESLTARLLETGLLRRRADGGLVATGVAWTTKDGIPSRWIRDSHRDALALAGRVLDGLPMEKRDFISLTFSGDTKNFERARREVRRFKDRMAKIMGAGAPQSVYRLQVQFFPLDQWDES